MARREPLIESVEVDAAAEVDHGQFPWSLPVGTTPLPRSPPGPGSDLPGRRERQRQVDPDRGPRRSRRYEPRGGRLQLLLLDPRLAFRPRAGAAAAARESFLALLMNRFGPDGLYLLDEPEAALSAQNRLTCLRRMHQLVGDGSRFVVATPSPILLAYPGCSSSEPGPHPASASFLDRPPRVDPPRALRARPADRCSNICLDDARARARPFARTRPRP